MTEERLADLSVIAMHYEERVPAGKVCKKLFTEIVHTVFVRKRHSCTIIYLINIYLAVLS